MQVLFKFKARSVVTECCSPSQTGTHFSTAVFQQDVDVLLVLEMVIKVHDVFVVQRSVQLDFSVDLREGGERQRGEGVFVNRDFFRESDRAGGARSTHLLALVRLGDARVRDDFGRVNFAGGEVGHLVALGETSLRGQRWRACG